MLYSALCMVQFYLLPSPRATPGTSPAIQAQGWGIVWSGLVSRMGGRGARQIENINFLLFHLVGWHNGAGRRGEDWLFPEKISSICK